MTDFLPAFLPVTRFEPHRARLTSLARGWLGNHADAQDAVQDAWLRVQSGVPPALDSDAAWLVTVLRHVCIDRLRRRQLEAREAPMLADDALEPSAEHQASLNLDTRAALRHMASVLPADDLAALLLHAVFEFEHGEIARMAGQTEAAMRQRVRRALRRARARIASGEVDGDDSPASADQEASFSLAWRALRLRSAAGLIAQVVRAPTQLRAVSPRASAIGDACGTAPRGTSQVLQLDGAFALAWVLDGVVLCMVPVGVTSGSDAEAVTL